MVMIVVDTQGEVNQKETKVLLTTMAGALDMRGFNQRASDHPLSNVQSMRSVWTDKTTKAHNN